MWRRGHGVARARQGLALAVSAAHACRERFSDGQLHVDVPGASLGLAPLCVGEMLARILRALGLALPRLPAAEGAGEWLDAERTNLLAAVRQGLDEASRYPT